MDKSVNMNTEPNSKKRYIWTRCCVLVKTKKRLDECRQAENEHDFFASFVRYFRKRCLYTANQNENGGILSATDTGLHCKEESGSMKRRMALSAN